jgi:hypothetical protein
MNPKDFELRKVALGLQLVYAGLILTVLGVILGVAAVMYFTSISKPYLGMLFTLGISLVAGMLDVAGKLLCLAVPEKSRSSGIISASVACTLSSLIIGLVGQFSPAIGSELKALGGLLSALAYILFLIFLRRLAMYIGHLELAANAWSILIASVLVATAYAGLLAMVASGVAASLPLPFIILGLGLAALVVFILYANLITYLRRAVMNFVEAQTMA